MVVEFARLGGVQNSPAPGPMSDPRGPEMWAVVMPPTESPQRVRPPRTHPLPCGSIGQEPNGLLPPPPGVVGAVTFTTRASEVEPRNSPPPL